MPKMTTQTQARPLFAAKLTPHRSLGRRGFRVVIVLLAVLATIPGIGVMNATALIAAIGDGHTFARGRDLAAWLGLVPRQMTTGGKARLVGITKRGNKYLRKLLIHGARSAMPILARTESLLGQWLWSLLARTHRNAVVVALANKLARIAWAVLRQRVGFQMTTA